MKFLINFLSLLIFIFSLHISANEIQAISITPKRLNFNFNSYTPTFPRCPKPGGTLVASYVDGWHWIVGDPVLKWGSDTVSHIGNNNYVQCFCPLNQNGSTVNTSLGTQTNWLKVSNITEDQKNMSLSNGWILVANGAVFGLLPEPYLAKNSSFFCSGPDCLTEISVNNIGIKTNYRISSNSGSFSSQISENTQIKVTSESIINP